MQIFRINSDTATAGLDVVAVKTELGFVQTLAHQDADGNWVLNDPPPNKALELAKCQRYYYQTANTALTSGGAWIAAGVHTRTAISSSYLNSVSLPVEMRATPAITTFFHGNDNKIIASAVGEWAEGTMIPDCSAIYANNKSFVIKCADTNSVKFAAGKIYGFHYIASADL